MRPFGPLLLLLLFGLATASDLTFCKKQCAGYYATSPEDLSSCEWGCGKRGSASDGTRGFTACHEACAAEYNETATARASCDFACGLAMVNMVVVKMEYGKDGGEPVVQITRKEGMDEMGALARNHFRKLFRDFSGLGEKDAEGEKKAESLFESNWPSSPKMSDLWKFSTGDEEMDAMQNRFRSLMNSAFNDMQMQMQRPRHHENAAFLGPAVDNDDGDGHQLIAVSQVDGEERWSDFHSYQSRRNEHFRLNGIYQWSVCIALLSIAALTTLLLMRHLRMHRYRALQAHDAGGPPPAAPPVAVVVASSKKALTMESPALHKKIPIETDGSSLPEPTGVPPPAYDQLSVHSQHAAP